MSKCCNCGAEFEKKHSGYNRYSVQKIVGRSRELRQVLSEVLDLVEDPVTPLTKSTANLEDRCLCTVCYAITERIEKRRNEIVQLKETFRKRIKPDSYIYKKMKKEESKRQSYSETIKLSEPPKSKKKSEPSPKPAPQPTRTTRRIRTSFVRIAYNHMKSSKYDVGIRFLLKKSPRARQDFMRVVKSVIRHEVHVYCRNSSYTSQVVTRARLEDFSWHSYFEEIKKQLPLLHTVIGSFVTLRSNERKLKMDKDGTMGDAVPGLCLVAAILLHLRKRGRFSLIQSIITLNLYREGCSQMLQAWFKKTGISLVRSAGKQMMRKLVEEFDAQKSGQTCEATDEAQNESASEESEDDSQDEEQDMETEGDSDNQILFSSAFS